MLSAKPSPMLSARPSPLPSANKSQKILIQSPGPIKASSLTDRADLPKSVLLYDNQDKNKILIKKGFPLNRNSSMPEIK